MPPIDSLSAVVSLLIALSVASERFVEIIKNLIPYLNEQKSDPVQEGRRKAALQALAVIAGIITALLAWPAIDGVKNLPDVLHHPVGIVALGLLASGGSGLWNAVATYLLNVKDLKKIQVIKAKS